nr:hypothetical protein Itr_chr13CG17790 [Ipomoea trifida]
MVRLCRCALQRRAGGQVRVLRCGEWWIESRVRSSSVAGSHYLAHFTWDFRAIWVPLILLWLLGFIDFPFSVQMRASFGSSSFTIWEYGMFLKAEDINMLKRLQTNTMAVLVSLEMQRIYGDLKDTTTPVCYSVCISQTPDDKRWKPLAISLDLMFVTLWLPVEVQNSGTVRLISVEIIDYIH